MLAIALLLAQVGALLHAASHDGPRPGHAGIHAQLCGQCLSFSTVLSVAGGPGAGSVLPEYVVASPAGTAPPALADRRAPSAFRSRAPPRAR